MKRVVVVGGGLAGASAAMAAAEAGAEVTLVARAPGATALYAGAMELTGGVEGVLGREAFHPFSRLYRDPLKLAADLDEAGGDLAARLGRAGLPVQRRPGSYLDVNGAARPADLAPVAVARGELGSLRGRRVAVVGVDGVASLDAARLARVLREDWGVLAEAVVAPVDGLPPGAAATDLFRRPAPPARANADLVAYPPGFESLPENAFELLMSPPAPHGWRLQGALGRALATAGVEVSEAAINGFRTRDGRVEAAIGEAQEKDEEWPGEEFILATGRFIGGGLRKHRMVSEPLLDLPVYYQGELVAAARGRLRHLEYLDPRPAFQTGLLTDSQLRPVDASGQPVLTNLRAAGSILGGYDSVGGGCGFGVPLLTGRLAGRWAAA